MERTWMALWVSSIDGAATVTLPYYFQALNAGEDPHLMMGAQTLGISLEEAKARKKGA